MEHCCPTHGLQVSSGSLVDAHRSGSLEGAPKEAGSGGAMVPAGIDPQHSVPSGCSEPVLLTEDPGPMEVMARFVLQSSQGCGREGLRKARSLHGVAIVGGIKTLSSSRLDTSGPLG